eukprot:Skav205988  [mRNA]  locus=scaffold2084:28356:34128:+ [translate_table: standard]
MICGSSSPHQECWIGEWCEPAGADGFAFVIQNEGRKIVGPVAARSRLRVCSIYSKLFKHEQFSKIEENRHLTNFLQISVAIFVELDWLVMIEASAVAASLSWDRGLAVEFDMYRNPDLGELSGNHISVHVPPRKGEPNSADHRLSFDYDTQAYTDDIPPLQEGTHVVRIVYDVRRVRMRAQERGSAKQGNFQATVMGIGHGWPVTEDLSYIVNVDGTEKASANTPRQPDPEAYDEKGASPGRAWEYAACPLDGVEDSRATVRGQGPEAWHAGTMELTNWLRPSAV